MSHSRFLILAALLLGACQPEPPDQEEIIEHMPSVSGHIAFEAQQGLPPGAVLEVQLQDISRADAPALIVAESLIFRPERSPVAFDLQFDPDTIEPGHSYAVTARIQAQGRLLFVTERQFPVLTRGAPGQIDISMIQVVPRDLSEEQVTDRLVASIRDSLSRLEASHGSREMGDTRLRYSAWSDGVDIVYLWEARQVGERGQSTVHLYFNDGSLVLYREDGVISLHEGTTSRPVHRQLEMYFSNSGRMISGRLTLDGQVSDPPGAAIEGAWSHARGMLDWIAWEAAVGMPAEGMECRAMRGALGLQLGRESASLQDPGVEGRHPYRGQATLHQDGRILWRGSGPDGDLSVTITPGLCDRGLADAAEGPVGQLWSHRMMATLPDGSELAACCRHRETRLLSEQASALAKVPVADLAGAAARGHWTGRLLQMGSLLELCLARMPADSPRVLDTSFPNPGVAVLTLVTDGGAAYRCAGLLNGHAGIEFLPLDPASQGREPGLTLFSPQGSGVPSGACYQHEQVLDEDGKLLGYLSHDSC